MTAVLILTPFAVVLLVAPVVHRLLSNRAARRRPAELVELPGGLLPQFYDGHDWPNPNRRSH